MYFIKFKTTAFIRYQETLRILSMCFQVFFCIWWWGYRWKQTNSYSIWNDWKNKHI